MRFTCATMVCSVRRYKKSDLYFDDGHSGAGTDEASLLGGTVVAGKYIIFIKESLVVAIC